MKLAVLVDGGSASASEILAGALSDHKKAILMGTNTYGKGTVQELIPFDDGTSLKVTIAKWILPNGEWISYKGIAPDIEIKISEDEIKEAIKYGTYSNNVDAQLQKAIKKLRSIKTTKEFKKIIDDAQKHKEELKKQKRKEELKKLLEKK